MFSKITGKRLTDNFNFFAEADDPNFTLNEIGSETMLRGRENIRIAPGNSAYLFTLSAFVFSPCRLTCVCAKLPENECCVKFRVTEEFKNRHLNIAGSIKIKKSAWASAGSMPDKFFVLYSVSL